MAVAETYTIWLTPKDAVGGDQLAKEVKNPEDAICRAVRQHKPTITAQTSA